MGNASRIEPGLGVKRKATRTRDDKEWPGKAFTFAGGHLYIINSYYQSGQWQAQIRCHSQAGHGEFLASLSLFRCEALSSLARLIRRRVLSRIGISKDSGGSLCRRTGKTSAAQRLAILAHRHVGRSLWP